MKTTKQLATAVLATLAALVFSGSTLSASDVDDRIEAAARKTYVFKTILKDDDIKTECKDGVVVLTGTVADTGHRSLAETTVESLPGVDKVVNGMTIAVPVAGN